MITVRYFAAAAEAAGVGTESFDLAAVEAEALTIGADPAAVNAEPSALVAVDARAFDMAGADAEPSDVARHGGVASTDDVRTSTTAGALRRAMVAAHGPDLGRVLTRCSLLAAGRRLHDDDAPVEDGVTVDVLPPFAGG